ncbi:MAG: HEAT repeat protein [bacterium]|jgi:HEAT repeat protein
MLNKRLSVVALLFFFLATVLSSCASLQKAQELNENGQNKKALDMAKPYLTSSKASERKQAVIVVRNIGKTRAFKKQAGALILKTAEDGNADVQVAAFKALAVLKYTAGSEKLVSLIPETSGYATEELAKALGKMGGQAIDLVVEKFNSPSQAGNKDKFKRVITLIGGATTNAIRKHMKNKSYFQNRENIDLLVSFQNPEVATQLVKYLEDQASAPGSEQALVKLGRLAVDAIVRDLKFRKGRTSSDNDSIMERLVRILGKIRSKRAVPVLEELATYKSERVRNAVDQALNRIRGF